MTGRERVLRTLAFQGTDRIPMDMWVLPAARLHHGKAFEDLCRKNADKLDIAAFVGPFDHGFTPEYTRLVSSPILGAASGAISRRGSSAR